MGHHQFGGIHCCLSCLAAKVIQKHTRSDYDECVHFGCLDHVCMFVGIEGETKEEISKRVFVL